MKNEPLFRCLLIRKQIPQKSSLLRPSVLSGVLPDRIFVFLIGRTFSGGFSVIQEGKI